MLDLVPVSSGSDPSDRAAQLDRPGPDGRVVGLCPLLVRRAPPQPGGGRIIATGARRRRWPRATKRIRVGSGGVQSGHRTALSVVEEFGLLDALHPGRIDLGIGRSVGREALSQRHRPKTGDPDEVRPRRRRAYRTTEGLLIPERPSLKGLANSPRLALTADLHPSTRRRGSPYTQMIEDVLGLLEGTYRSSDGIDPHPVPGAGAGVDLWILGSSAGESAALAGRLGLRFAANYHVSPSTVLEAVRRLSGGLRPLPIPRPPLCGHLGRRGGGTGRRRRQ